jgi:hypothetical protein
MRAVLFAALLATGCRYDLDEPTIDANVTGRSCKVTTSASCQEAESHSDLTWIKTKVFAANCFGSSCHTGTAASGEIDLTDDPYTSLMGATGTGGVKANLDPAHDRVVAGDPKQSYLFFIIRGVKAEEGSPPFVEPSDEIGYMPMSTTPLCCQKIDAIERWITQGAQNN